MTKSQPVLQQRSQNPENHDFRETPKKAQSLEQQRIWIHRNKKEK